MKNYVQPTNIVNFTAPVGGITSGTGRLFGGLFGVATSAASEGERVAVSLEGIFILPKVEAASFTEGAAAYWDGAKVTADSEANTFIGHVVVAAAAGSFAAEVRIKN